MYFPKGLRNVFLLLTHYYVIHTCLDTVMPCLKWVQFKTTRKDFCCSYCNYCTIILLSWWITYLNPPVVKGATFLEPSNTDCFLGQEQYDDDRRVLTQRSKLKPVHPGKRYLIRIGFQLNNWPKKFTYSKIQFNCNRFIRKCEKRGNLITL